jgi:hypothetical protein
MKPTNPEFGQWQDIETAPLRGEFLVYDLRTQKIYLASSYLDGYRVFEEVANNGCRQIEIHSPKFWMPLPKPPIYKEDL